MTKTIAQLWNGSLEPCHNFGLKNSEIRQLEKLMLKNGENLEANLNEKERDIFLKYSDCVNEYTILIAEQAFCDGFCLGAKIITEALTGADEITSE